jgi:hypothetical protein
LHVLSVAGLSQGDVHGKQLLHHTHCDFCLSAAAMAGGVLPGHSPSSPHDAGQHETPRAISTDVWVALAAWAHRSRAPPSASH